MPESIAEETLELRLTFAPEGEIVVLWRQQGEDWRQRPAPRDLAQDLRRIRAWLLGEMEVVSEAPGDLLLPLPGLMRMTGAEYPTDRMVETAVRIKLETPPMRPRSRPPRSTPPSSRRSGR